MGASAGVAGWPAPLLAQQPYPSRSIRLISPFAPGGGNDALCRVIAPKLAEHLKQQVFIDNRAGANGIVGTEIAARAAPDGYTIILIPSGHAVNASLHPKLPFDTIKDFTPISLAGSSPLILAGHPSLPAKNVRRPMIDHPDMRAAEEDLRRSLESIFAQLDDNPVIDRIDYFEICEDGETLAVVCTLTDGRTRHWQFAPGRQVTVGDE